MLNQALAMLLWGIWTRAPSNAHVLSLAVSSPHGRVSASITAELDMGHWDTCPLVFGRSVHSAAAFSLTAKIYKITKEKTCIKVSCISPETR